MGIERSAVNVSDLSITRPDRSGPGGDIVGTPTSIGSGLLAVAADEDRLLRRSDGSEAVAFSQFFIDPILAASGAIVPVRIGDLATWTDLQGVVNSEQEIIQVQPTQNCDGGLDIVSFRVGRSTGAAL